MTTRRIIAIGTTVAALGALTTLALSTQPGTPAQGATPVAVRQAPATTSVRTVVVHRTVHVPARSANAHRRTIATTSTVAAPIPTVTRGTDDTGASASEHGVETEPGDDHGGQRETGDDRGGDDQPGDDHGGDRGHDDD